MTAITIYRTDKAMPGNLDSASDLLFGALDGFNKDDRRAWRSFWKRILAMEPGEMAVVEARMPRSGPYHRRHFKIVSTVFDAQERFASLEQFVNWLKIGAGWVDWVPGAKGGIVPLPKSISYTAADQEEFTRYHEGVVEFLRGGHAAKFLWKHLGDHAGEMMETLLMEFER